MTPEKVPADRWPALYALFGIDLRSLALLRVMLGLMLLAMVPAQWFGLGALYGDSGVAPRHWILQAGEASRLSLHMISGSGLFECLLIALQTVAALCLLLGRASRRAALLSFLLWVSWLNRYPLVVGGGDLVLAWLLFWAAWQPLGARFGFDAALSDPPPPSDPPHLSVAGAALRITGLMVLAMTAVLTLEAPWRWPALGVLAVLALAPLAGRVGGLLRGLLVGVAALAVLAAALGLPASGALYPALLATLTVWVGGGAWQWLAQRPRARQPLTIYYDEHCGFCLKAVQLLRTMLALQATELRPAQSRARTATLMERYTSWIVIDAQDQAHLKWAAMVALLRASPLMPGLHHLFALRLWQRPGDALYDWVARHRSRLGNVTAWLWPRPPGHPELPRSCETLAGVALLLSLAWAAHQTLPGAPLRGLMQPALMPWHLDTDWREALQPRRDDATRLVVSGEMADGRPRNLLAPGTPVDFRNPPDPADASYRWQQYWSQLATPAHRGHRRWYARSLCTAANGAEVTIPGPNALLTVQIDRVSAGEHDDELERVTLWRQDCFGPDRGRP